ncbi:MAG: hypothetical protein QOG55_270 [Acidobacteriaceae bacterium]|nr:hypothetical protein [Acidobacteriaceae bacterium]
MRRGARSPGNHGHPPQRRIVWIGVGWPRRNRCRWNDVALLEVCDFINIVDGAAGGIDGVGKLRNKIDSLLLRGADIRRIRLDVQSGLAFVPAEYDRECRCALKSIGTLQEFLVLPRPRVFDLEHLYASKLTPQVRPSQQSRLRAE